MYSNPVNFYAKVNNTSLQYETNVKIVKKTDNSSSKDDSSIQKNSKIKNSSVIEYEVGTKKTEELNGNFFQKLTSVKKIENLDAKKLITNKSLILGSENDLSIEDRVKKTVLEKVLSQFNVNSESVKLIPNDAFSFSYEQVIQTNFAGYPTGIPNNFSYTKIDEHFEFLDAKFNGKVVFETENEIIEIDLNLSYSKEFIIHNEKEIGIMEKNLAENKLFIDGKGLDDTIKDLDSVSIVFDIFTELDNTRNRIFFEFFSKLFSKEEVQSNNNLSDFKIFMQNKSEEYVAIGIQKGDSAVYLSSMERVNIST